MFAAKEIRLPTRMPSPTSVLPGPDKVAVLTQRETDGEFLWHPGDARRT